MKNKPYRSDDKSLLKFQLYTIFGDELFIAYP